MLLRTLIAASLVGSACAVAPREAEDRATVHLRDGTTIEGRVEALAGGVLLVRVSPEDQRRFPVADVALIDRTRGASALPATELREARGAAHLLLLTGGPSLKGRLMAIKGGEGSGDDRRRTYIFRTFDGLERHYEPSEVARIHLGSRPFEQPWGPTPARGPTPATGPSRGVRAIASQDRVSPGGSPIQRRSQLVTAPEVVEAPAR